MGHYDATLTADADAFIKHLDEEIIAGSASAKLEDTYETTLDPARMIVRVYERYSAMGGNRVSLNVSVLAVGGQLAISVTSSGGSEAIFWKVNTFGEEAFMKKAVAAIEGFGSSRPAGDWQL